MVAAIKRQIGQHHFGGSDRNRRRGYSGGRMVKMRELKASNRWAKGFVDSWDDKMHETAVLMKQKQVFYF